MEEQSPRAQQSSRSQASSNWRVRDDTLRAEAQPRFQRRTQQNGDPASPSAPGTRLYVGNLLYSAQQTDVEQLFTENGFTVAQITMSIDPFTGRNPSYCFVDLDSAEEANRAMTELNGKDVLGRTVKINPGIAKKSAATGNGPQARVNSYERGWPRDQSAAGAGNEDPKPTVVRGSRTDASNSWQNASEQRPRLYVGGLPWIEPQSAVEEEMQKLFQGFELQAVSKIISPHPSKASEPGNHCYLFVDLPSVEDVEAAIDRLNGQEAPWGGELKVSRARDNRERKANRERFGTTYTKPNGTGRWKEEPKDE